ncbi:mechanosensitive ion channel family protein, partial [bacterium]|nr:mechanosensitive ion channel family protein [bacterium]
SGLDFDLLCWINQPRLLGQITDELNTRVYKALNAANIEIPYAKQDLYIKEMPDRKSV